MDKEKVGKEIVFDIDPIPALRMVASDSRLIKYNRPRNPREERRLYVVKRYLNYKKELYWLGIQNKFKVPEVLSIDFILPIPKSWSNKKTVEMDGMPHQQTPDLDNLIKAFKDSLTENDAHVYKYIDCGKYWGKEGKIIVKQNI